MKNEDMLRADSLANKLQSGDARTFWKEVKRLNCGTVPLTDKIDGVSGNVSILDMWKEHYYTLFNSDTVPLRDEPDTKPSVSDNANADFVKTQVTELVQAIKQLPCNKSPGHDGLMSEHFQRASDRLPVLLSLLFNALIVHGFLPPNLMVSMLVPILKSKTGDITSKNNYRPIALSTVSSQLLELCMVSRLEPFLNSTDNQFAFKKKHSTDMCIFALKEMVRYYTNHGSPVYACFLDASKAFDKVNHSILFRTLKERGCPAYLLSLLIYWYRHQTLFIKWGNLLSGTIPVRKGVKQGGILSPRLFNVYIDALRVKLNCCHVGCCFNNTVINHLYYADDLCLLSPSAVGLSELLLVTERFAVAN